MGNFTYSTRKVGGEDGLSPKFNNLFDSVLAQLSLVLVSIFLLYNIFHSINITVQKLDILKNAQKQVNELRLENLELALLLEKMQDVEYLEVQARDRLNYSGEEEFVFVIPEAVLEGASGDVERLLGEGCSESVDQIVVWRDFLTKGI